MLVLLNFNKIKAAEISFHGHQVLSNKNQLIKHLSIADKINIRVIDANTIKILFR